jgi:hypothetical protein
VCPRGNAGHRPRDAGLGQRHHRSDGNDTKGPLDLAGAKVSHAPGGSVFQINTLAPFTNAEANGRNGLFEVGMDTNADRNSNYFIDVFFAAGRFRGVLFKPSGSVITNNFKAARVSPKAVKVTLPHSQIIQKGSYDFLIFSAYFATPCTNKNPCVDAIPNRYPLIRHDYTPPTITWGAVPTYSSDVTATVTFAAPFSLKDDVYGSGMKSWLLQRKAVGTSAWVTVKAGIALHPAVQVHGSEGTSYDLRIVSFDRQNNKRTSPTRRVNIPFDDRHPSSSTTPCRHRTTPSPARSWARPRASRIREPSSSRCPSTSRTFASSVVQRPGLLPA